MRVYLNKGRISSSIPRVTTGKRLYCFHIWHDAVRERPQADVEFKAKCGEVWTSSIMAYVQDTARRDRERSAVQG